MASIVYVTDKNMIEFHRLNGNQTLNFWRPMSQKKIRDFHPGDIIFFLTKTVNGYKGNEKGIVGYGRYVQSHYLCFDQMWRQFQQENGFATRNELYQAIASISNNKMPEQFHCLYIKDVLFFNHPIYLSEFGIQLPINMESYMYLNDHLKENITFQILEKAKEVGIDTWSAAMNNKIVDVLKFEEDLALQKISTIHQEIKDYPYTESEARRNKSVMKKYLHKDKWMYRIIYSEYEYMKFEQGRLHIYIPAHLSIKDNSRIKIMLGHLMMWNQLIERDNLNCIFHVLVDDKNKKLLERFSIKNERVIFECN
ncbi:MAG: hypothetical protein PUF50_08665 [Erysipelotrichaceae bacterium]|nr:hypothetical protein [Erysipelotrichaceae bacterium]